ncbi:MAG: glycosyl transferase [Gemmatales bacterium]|nr:MAG: glycosyl transferase [Gemmatales bacterium]
MQSSLSIIIPSYCRVDLLAKCLHSVHRHAPAGTQVIVVDDGSPARVVSRQASEWGTVHVVRLNKRRGFCAAANAGIEAATGDIVELLNDDTVVAAGWAEAALSAFTDHRVGAVAPLVVQRTPTGWHIDSAGDRYYVGGVAGKIGHRAPIETITLVRRRVFGASACAAFYRRQALEQIGFFPESFHAYFEDVDLSFRLNQAGYRIYFEPRSLVVHHGSASHRPGRKLLQQQSRNEERVFWRNLPAKDLLRALPSHLAVLVAKAWRRWQEGTLVPFLVGRLQLLAEIPALYRYRRSRPVPVGNLDTWLVEKRFWGPTLG